MIPRNFQSFSKDEIMILILRNNLHQPVSSILQQEIINYKCKNRKKLKQEMHVNKQWKEGKKMTQKVSEAPGMAKPKEN